MKASSGDGFVFAYDYYALRNSSKPFFIIGPCVLESDDIAAEVAIEAASISRFRHVTIYFKSSFDKANRTSVNSYRGPGIRKGLRMLAKIKEMTGLAVTSDIHSPDQAVMAAEVLDMIQIPAFMCRQTDLLTAAGNTGKIVNIKKGQWLSPHDMKYAVDKVLSTGNDKILLTERGSSFGYQDLVVDMRSVVRMRSLGAPVVFDATHSAQSPGLGDGCSGGDESLVPHLARAAVGAGADGVFLEVHPAPDKALCDGPNSLVLSDLDPLIGNLLEIYQLVPRSFSERENLQKISSPDVPLISSSFVDSLQKHPSYYF